MNLIQIGQSWVENVVGSSKPLIPQHRCKCAAIAAFLVLGALAIAEISTVTMFSFLYGAPRTTESHREQHLNKNCALTALLEHGSIYGKNSPHFFVFKTKAFEAIFFAVPGDDERWKQMQGRYFWQGHTSTLVLVGELFRRAKERGYSVSFEGEVALIDVGANMGQEVTVAGLFGYPSTTFEILPRSVATVKMNLDANCVDDRLVTIVNAGLDEISGIIQIDTTGFSAAFSAANTKGGNTTTTIWSLDEYFMAGNGGHPKLTSRPLLMKLDCEGCEAGALAGAQQLLEELPPHFIMIELIGNKVAGPIRHQVITLMEKYRYRVFLLAENDEFVPLSGVPDVEKRIAMLKDSPWTLDTSVKNAADVIFVHENAIDIGIFL